MTMLRTLVVALSCLLIVAGAYVCTLEPRLGGIQMLVAGVVMLLAVLFERWRYRNRQAEAGGNWQQTGERFVDPESGKEVEVLYDPQSGERRYREVG